MISLFIQMDWSTAFRANCWAQKSDTRALSDPAAGPVTAMSELPRVGAAGAGRRPATHRVAVMIGGNGRRVEDGFEAGGGAGGPDPAAASGSGEFGALDPVRPVSHC